MPSADLILLSFNLLLLVTLVLGFLAGVIKGFYKSLFYLIFSIVIFVGGIIAIPFISDMLLNMDASFLNNVLPEDINVEITTLKESLPELLAHFLPGQASMFTPGSETMALAFGIVKLVLNIVLFIVLLVLNATVFKVIPFIIWLFIRPKRNRLTGEKPKKHRMLGGLVGAVKAFGALLLVAIPFAGISSMVLEAESIYLKLNDDSGTTAHVESINTLALEDEDEMIKQAFDMFRSYKTSIIGTVFGAGNLDVNIFDAVFKVDVKSEDTNEKIYLRRDIVKTLSLIDIILEANDNSTDFDPTFLFKITEAELLKVQKEIKDISFINVAKNIGAEYGYDYLVKENLIEGYEDEITLSLLKSINLNNELNTLIDVVIIISESEAQEEILENAFALTQSEATAVFNKLAELQVIQIGLPIAVNFALNMPETIQTMQENNIDPNDLARPTDEELISDFKNIVNIYNLAKDMGFNHPDEFGNINEEFALQIEEEHVIDLFNIVFNFALLYKNDELFANLAYDFATKELDPEYLDIISRETLVNNFNAGELASIALLGKLLYTESLFSTPEQIDFTVVLREENVEKIATYISESNILSEGMDGLLHVFTADMDFVEIVVPAEFSFKGAGGKTEIKAILNSVRNMFELGLTDENVDFGAIEDEKIEELATNFSSSQIIRFNLTPILNELIEQTEFTFLTIDEDESFWTKDEIYYMFRAVKILTSEEIDITGINKLEDEKVLEISRSKLVSNSIGKFLVNENEAGGMLNGQLVIPEGLTYYSEEDEPGEVYYFFVGIKEIMGEDGLDGFNVEMENVLDMDIELVFESKILEATIVEDHLKFMSIEENLGKYIIDAYENGTDFDWYIGENPSNPGGDSIPLVRALAELDEIGISYGTMNYANFITILENDPGRAQDINDIILSSHVLNASLPKMMNKLMNIQGGLDVDVYPHYNKEDLDYWGEDGVNKELFYILDALIAADELKDFDYETLDDSNKEAFKDDANLIARSETLRQVLPRIIEDSNLTMADDLRSGVDPNSLTEAEWNNEIDVLVDIIVLINENPTIDFDNPAPEDIPILIEIRTLMIDSLLYDETKLIL